MSKDGEWLHNLFLEASELTGEERRQWLDEHCADDPALRRKLESLLRQDEAGGTLPRLHELVQPVLRESGSTVGDDLGSSTVPEALPTSLLEDPLLANVPVQNGAKVLRQFVLVERLGAGGMGAVYRATHQRLRVERAIKCLLPTAGRAESLQRFEREARVAAQVEHEHLVQVYDIDHAHGLHYIVMEYIAGRTLTGWVREEGAIPARRACEVILAAARGLSMAHERGIVHRDIKPGNIMLRDDGLVKVVDLGLAKAAEGVDSLMTRSHAFMGTPQYMPPEQYDGAAAAGAPADVYGLAATLSFLLTGRDPFAGLSSSQIMRILFRTGFPQESLGVNGLPDAVRGVIVKATSAEPEKRHPDAGALAAEIEACLESLDDEGGKATPEGGSEETIFRQEEVPPPTHQQLGPSGGVKWSHGFGKAPAERRRAVPVAILTVLALSLVGFVMDPWGWLAGAPDIGSGDEAASTTGASLEDDDLDPASIPEVDDGEATPVAPEMPPWTPPSVELLDPELLDGRMVVAGGQLSIRGHVVAESPGALELLLDGQAVAETEFLAASREDDQAIVFEDVALPDASGEVEARLRAQGDDVLAWTIVVDPDPPELILDSDALGDGWTAADSFTLTGTANDPHLESVVVRTGDASRDAAVSGDGRWSVDVPLPRDGVHEVIVEAADSVANAATAIATLRRDSRPPELSIDAEALGDGWTGEDVLSLEGSVSDPHLESVVLLTGDTTLDAAFTEEDRWTADVPLPTDGQYYIEVQAADVAGNLASADASLHRDATPPEVRPIDPPAQVSAEAVNLVFSVEDASEVELSIGATTAEQDADGLWTAVVALPVIGENLLSFEATDRLGNVTRSELTIERLDPFDARVGEVASQTAPVAASWTRGDPVPSIAGLTYVGENEEGYPEYDQMLPGDVPLRLVLLPAGSFVMGDDSWYDNEGPRQSVALDAYLLAKTECTQQQWRSVIGDQPSAFQNAGDDAPVEQVSWEDIQGFLARTDLVLPSEAQWEYAARSGSEEALYTGSLSELDTYHGPELDPIAWYGGNSGVYYAGAHDSSEWEGKQYPHRQAGTHPVGLKQANAFGLHDMLGNVWELCADRWRPSHVGARGDGWPRLGTAASTRVVRGGSWSSSTNYCTTACRVGIDPTSRDHDTGFRPARLLSLSPGRAEERRGGVVVSSNIKLSEDPNVAVLGQKGTSTAARAPTWMRGDPAPAIEDLVYMGVNQKGLPEYDHLLPGNTPLRMVLLPAGSFTMYSSDGFEERRITLDAFLLAKNECTVQEWLQATSDIIQRRPSYAFLGKGADHPRESVSWNDIQVFERETGLILPSEAQWEYAALAGTGDILYGELDRIAWHAGNAGETTTYIRQFEANAFGLHDMIGNVWEWCEDSWHDDVAETPSDGRAWVEAGASERVLRGGDYRVDPDYLYALARGSGGVAASYRAVGFRPARSLSEDALGGEAVVGQLGMSTARDAPTWVRGSPAPSIDGLVYRGLNEQGYPVYDKVLLGGVTMPLVLLPAASYAMGSIDVDIEEGWTYREGPVHTVNLSAFLIAETECTERQWQAVMDDTVDSAEPDFPIVGVSWDDIRGFTRRTGLALPSEAQWEYAARAGTEGPRHGPIDDVAWYTGNRGSDRPQEVSTKAPNGFGLYDVLGNVSEWCFDWWDHTHEGAPDDGSARLKTDSGAYELNVIRGGSWEESAEHCRSAYRWAAPPGTRYPSLGFRPVYLLD